VVHHAVHGVQLAIGLRTMEGASHPKRGVLGGTLGGHARRADDLRDVLAAVFPFHVQKDRDSVRGDHAIRPAGDERQTAAGTLILFVVAQPRAATNVERFPAQREALFVVGLVASSRRLEHCPRLQDELQETGADNGLGLFLGGGAALRREGVRLGLGHVLEFSR